MKKWTTIFLLLFAASSQADATFGVRVSNQSTPVVIEHNNFQLNTEQIQFQFSYHFDQISIGLAYDTGETDKSWQLNDNKDAFAYNNQTNSEFYVSYYLNDWFFSAAVGQSDIDFNQYTKRFMPSRNHPFVDKVNSEAYQSKDKYYELSTGYWFDLDKVMTDLSLSFDVFATYFESEGLQTQKSEISQLIESERLTQYLNNQDIALGTQNAAGFRIEDNQWQYGYLLEFNYPVEVVNQLLAFSLWQGTQYAKESNGILTTSRLLNGQRLRTKTFPLDETGQQQPATDIASVGADIEWYVNDQLSFGIHLNKVESFDWQWQLSSFYSF